MGTLVAIAVDEPETVNATTEDAPSTAPNALVPLPSREIAPARETPSPLARRPTLPAVPPDALSAALLLARRPLLAKNARNEPLPADVVWLIRIAAGSAETLSRAVQITGKDPTFIRAAAEFYLEEVLGTEQSDDLRVLGLRPGATLDEAAEHTRWLARWLLPHLGRPDPEAAQLERILAAWSRLRTGGMTPKPAGSPDLDTAAAPALHRPPRWQVAALLVVGIAAIGLVALSNRLPGPAPAGLAAGVPTVGVAGIQTETISNATQARAADSR